MRQGRFAFRPGWPLTLIAVALTALFVRLGFWQLERALQSESFNATVDERASSPVVDLDTGAALPPDVRFRRIHVTGRFEPDKQILLDNQVHESTAGVLVITPLKVTNSEVRILVDRGWMPLDPGRQRLPQPQTPAAEVEVKGVADIPVAPAFMLGTALQPSSRLWPYLDLPAFERFSGFKVRPFVIRQDQRDAGGFVRAWQAP